MSDSPHLTGASVKVVRQEEELLDQPDLGRQLHHPQQPACLHAPDVEETGASASHQEPAVSGRGKGPVVGGGAKGGWDLVAVDQRLGFPGVDRVVLEAGEDGTTHRLEEDLQQRQLHRLDSYIHVCTLDRCLI